MAERTDPQAGDSMVASDGAAEARGGADDHGAADGHDDHAHDDAHGDAHGGASLGPIDVKTWGAAALGIALGLVVVLALVQAAS